MVKAREQESVAIIGAGNVGIALAYALQNHFKVFLVKKKGKVIPARENSNNVKVVEDITEINIAPALVIIAVQDRKIGEVVQAIPSNFLEESVIVHTSGSVSVEVLRPARYYGCLYPLQSFVKGREVSWNDIPIFVEGNCERALARIMEVAGFLSRTVFILDSERRKLLHAGAVFASNFTNFMYVIASRIAEKVGVPFDVYLPLIMETASRLKELSPIEAQTGPARRGDWNTLSAHIELLSKVLPEMLLVYKDISWAISTYYSRSNSLPDFRKAKILVFDIDGVMTDGTLLPVPEGEFIRNMNIKDGYALQLAVKQGMDVVVISGSHAHAFVRRFSYLGVKDIFLAVEDKLSFVKNLCRERGWDMSEVLYMGDDIPDIPLLKAAGISCAPSNSAAEVLAIVDYVSPYEGGRGAVRDVIEIVLKAQGKWVSIDVIDTKFLW